jgi:hypothetical protein
MPVGFLRFPGVGMMIRNHEKTHPVRGGLVGVANYHFNADSASLAACSSLPDSNETTAQHADTVAIDPLIAAWFAAFTAAFLSRFASACFDAGVSRWWIRLIGLMTPILPPIQSRASVFCVFLPLGHAELIECIKHVGYIMHAPDHRPLHVLRRPRAKP